VATPASVQISPELARIALSCEPMERALRLARWVGPDRTLTVRGVLSPTDAMQACRHLGIPVRGPRLRSALDVDQLMRDWMTAVAAGLVEIDGRRARALPGLPGADADLEPMFIVSAWAQAAAVFLDVAEEPCDSCLTVLHELLTAGGPVTLDQLLAAVEAMLEPGGPAGAPCPGCGEVHDQAGQGELFGPDEYGDDDEDGEDDPDPAGHVADTVETLLAFGAAGVADETVQLTPLGTFLVHAVLASHAPLLDDGPAVLVSLISQLPPAVARTAARPWLEARSPAQAGRELLTFAESAAGNDRAVALHLARELGPGAWQEWAEQPGTGAYAREWLRSQDEAAAGDPADEAWLAVDGLIIMLDTLAEAVPPSALRAALAQQLGDAAADAAELAAQSGHPRAAELVALLTGRPVPAAGRQAVALVYTIKITLRHVSRPPVWRRVVIPADATFRDLHIVIQLAMGWEDDHLYRFGGDRRGPGPRAPEIGRGADRRVFLSQVLTRPGDQVSYLYDFGDDWEHDLLLEEARAAEPGGTYPSCTAGSGACPPEDCGGPGGYAWLKEILASPSHPEHAERLEWLGLTCGADFSPAEFSVAEASARLRALSAT
jgi:hypothetical protein